MILTQLTTRFVIMMMMIIIIIMKMMVIPVSKTEGKQTQLLTSVG